MFRLWRTKILHVSSHRRSGTHALIDLIRTHFTVYGQFYHLEELDDAALGQRAPLVVKSHEPKRGAKLAFLGEKIPRKTAKQIARDSYHFYAHRNPYDVLKSLYFFNLAGHEPVHKIDPETTFEEFLRQTGRQDANGDENRVDFWFRCMRNWMNDPQTVPVAFDDLMLRPNDVVNLVARTAKLRAHSEAPAGSTAIGRGTTAQMTQSDIWSEEALEFFREHADPKMLQGLGYILR